MPFPGSLGLVMESLAIGVLVGLERRSSQKRIGVRTFASICLAGTLTWWRSPQVAYGLLALLVPLLTVLNVYSLFTDGSLEITTSVAVLVTALLGILVGQGLWLEAATCAALVTMLLAWKVRLQGFAQAITIQEVRGAVIVATIGFVGYPLLPARPIDPWGVIDIRAAWVGVLAIAGIGFLNYIVLRLWGARGIVWTGLLGGFINSRAVAIELAVRARGDPARLWPVAMFGILSSNTAMVLRNGLILAVVAPASLRWAAPALGAMLGTNVVLAVAYRTRSIEPMSLRLGSPVALKQVLAFGVVFLIIGVAGALAQRFVGHVGFLLVSGIGGLVSSASTVVAAAVLAAQGRIQPNVAAYGVTLASMITLLSNIPAVHTLGNNQPATRRLMFLSAISIAAGIVGLVITTWVVRS